jgi:hypothetical protein
VVLLDVFAGYLVVVLLDVFAGYLVVVLLDVFAGYLVVVLLDVFAGYLALVLLTRNQLYRYEVSAQTLLLFAIVRYFALHLAMQSVPLTTNVNYIPVCGEVYSIQLYMIILEHWFDTDRWFSSGTLVFHAIQTGRSDHLVESGIKRPYHFNCAI